MRRLEKVIEAERRRSPNPTKKEIIFQPLEEILGVGVDLFDEAVAAIKDKTGDELKTIMRRARMLARDGLLIIFFCHIPLRESDMARVDLREHFKWVGGERRFQMTTEKTGVKIDLPIPPEFGRLLDIFEKVFRPYFSETDFTKSCGRLRISRLGAGRSF